MDDLVLDIECICAVGEMEHNGVGREYGPGKDLDVVESAQVCNLLDEQTPCALPLDPDLDGDDGRSSNFGVVFVQIEELVIEILARQSANVLLRGVKVSVPWRVLRAR